MRSKAHPGDGLWHRLELTVRIPAVDEMAEFRLRNYRGGATYIREASLAPGSRSAVSHSPTAAVDGGPRALWFVPMAALALMVPVYFRRRRTMIHARLAEAGLTLIVISNIMLLTSRPEASAAASNIAWALASVASLVFALAVFGGRAATVLRTPGVVYSAVFIAVLAVLLYELAVGSVAGAGDAAAVLFALVVIESGLMAVRKVRDFFLSAKENEGGTVRIKSRDDFGEEDPPAGFDQPEGEGPAPDSVVGAKPVSADGHLDERVPMG